VLLWLVAEVQACFVSSLDVILDVSGDISGKGKNTVSVLQPE
jgi:hypothetical protein